MNRLIITACIVVCIAMAGGCGSDNSTPASTVKPVFSNSTTVTIVSTASGDLLGGNIQKGPFAFKQLNFSTTTSPAFRHVSSAAFNGPIAVTTDGPNHYVVDYISSKINKITPNGDVTLFAGGGFGNFSTASSARFTYFNAPTAITTDATGTVLYIADSANHSIRKIDANGMVSRLAGTGVAGSEDTSLAVVARFNFPSGITAVGTNLFIVDSGNHTIRMYDTVAKAVTTFAGYPGVSGSADGDRTVARFKQPARIASDGKNLYVTDFGNKTVRRISLQTGLVDTIAGHVGVTGTSNGTKGVSTFDQPNGIATDGINVYVTDYPYSLGDDESQLKGTVRRIELTSGNFNTTTLWSGLNTPIGITTNGTGLFVADRGTNTIFRIK